MKKSQREQKKDIFNYVFLKYTNKEMQLLLRMFKDICNLINPIFRNLDDFKKWYKGVEVKSEELASLIKGKIPYEDLPLYVFVTNEFFYIIARWRLKIGK